MKKEKPPSKHDQLVESYYMLARVVSQNTQMFEAVLNSFSPPSPQEPVEPNSDYPAIEEVRKQQLDEIGEVLRRVIEKCGRIKAEQFLDSFDAKSISQIAPANYEVFIKSGESLIKQYKGDVL